jgi:hypothetical protein
MALSIVRPVKITDVRVHVLRSPLAEPFAF